MHSTRQLPGEAHVKMLIALSSDRTCVARMLNASLMLMMKTRKSVLHHVGIPVEVYVTIEMMLS